MSKKALRGFSRVKMFPVINNDTTAYSVGPGFDAPEAQSMTKDTDSSDNKIYSDDNLYLNMKEWNGINSTITFVEVTHEMMEKWGFGKYNPATGIFQGKPQGSNLEFGVTFRCLMADNVTYRMFKYYIFTVTEIKESGIATKGTGGSVNAYQVSGTFTTRKVDDETYEMRDGTDMSWLDTIEPVTKA